MTGRTGTTAAGLLARQADDPTHQAMRLAQDRRRAELASKRNAEQRPILDDLAAVGVDVDWIGRLCEMPNPDPRIYAVLLDHLRRPYEPWLLEWIGRAFGRTSARPIVWDTLVKLVRSYALAEAATRGVMAALSGMAKSADVPTLIDLLADPAIGSSRIFLIRNLMRSRRPEARAALLRLRNDPDLALEIEARLSRSRG